MTTTPDEDNGLGGVVKATPVAREYQPPTGDEPLDAVEQALVRWLVAALLAKIRSGELQLDPIVDTSTRRRVG